MGRPRGSKNRSTVVKETTVTKSKDAVEVSIGEKQKFIGDHYYRVKFWENVPKDLMPTKETPHHTRVVFAERPDNRFLLVKVSDEGELDATGKPWKENGALITSPGDTYPISVRLNAVMIHSKNATYEPVPEGFEHYTGGHRAGTAAAEKAAHREAKKQARQKKLEDKEEAKRLKKERKIQERLDRKKSKASKKLRIGKTGKRRRPRRVIVNDFIQ